MFITRQVINQTRKMSIGVLKEIFLKSVEAVQPSKMIPEQIEIHNGHLSVGNQTYPLGKRNFIVGFGKAVYGMALEMEKLLGSDLEMGIVTIPDGSLANNPIKSRIRFIQGAANNIPDEKALAGAVAIKNLVESLTRTDLLLVLVSGGGSALLPLPKPPISLIEKQDLIRELSRKGADILELNCVRQQISTLKGGGLAELAYPAQVVALILSDIVGDPLDFIASGPTTPILSKVSDAVDIIKRYGCFQTLPASIRTVLSEIRHKPSDNNLLIDIPNGKKYKHVDNYIIGNNQRAAEAAKQHAVSLGFQSAIISTSLTGNVSEISAIYADLARNFTLNKQHIANFINQHEDLLHISNEFLHNVDLQRPICLIGAGEPTVVVCGDGKGGRNQQLALDFSLQLNNLNLDATSGVDISFLSAGTDGIDGPTDAAGAIGTLDLVNNCLAQNINPLDYLARNDAYEFYQRYSKGEYHVKTGHTGTNVMDIHILLLHNNNGQ